MIALDDLFDQAIDSFLKLDEICEEIIARTAGHKSFKTWQDLKSKFFKRYNEKTLDWMTSVILVEYEPGKKYSMGSQILTEL